MSSLSDLALFDMPNLNRFDILSISLFCKIALSISISIFSKITISISIFLELPYRYRYFQKWPYWYWYRYRYFSKVSIYRQSICHIDISNRASRGRRVISISGCWRKCGPNRTRLVATSSSTSISTFTSTWRKCVDANVAEEDTLYHFFCYFSYLTQ